LTHLTVLFATPRLQNLMKFICRIFAVASFVCILSARGQLVDGIKVVVDDALVTHVDVDLDMLSRGAVESLQRQYSREPDMFQKKLSEAETDSLQRLLDRQLILHEFKSLKVPETILDSEVDREIQQEIQSRYMDRMTLQKTLQAEGITYEAHRKQIRERIIIGFLSHKNVSSEVIISPHKVEAFYIAHTNDFKMQDEVKLRMIVLTNTPSLEAPQPKKLAEEILAKLKEGTEFGQLAAVYSQVSQRREKGEWMERAILRKEIADAAFKLKAGEYSDVIETSDGCYIVLVEDIKSSHMKSLGEVRDQIEGTLKLEERARLEKLWLAKLKKKTFVRYF
jgi:parvulin-like peptidyl-prolyl isomerase